MAKVKKQKLTSSEKQRQYREKRKLDPQRETQYKIKHKIRNDKRKKVSDMNPREHRNMKKIWRQYDKTRRNKEALGQIIERSLPSPSSSASLLNQNAARGKKLKETMAEYDNVLMKERNESMKKEASPQSFHLRFDDLTSSTTIEQEDKNPIDVEERFIQNYVQQELQLSTTNDNSSYLENQVTSNTRLCNEFTNSEFFIPTNHIQHVASLETRTAEDMSILDKDPLHTTSMNHLHSQTMDLCVLCAEYISENQWKNSVKEFFRLILNVTSIDVTQYPFEPYCCKTCYQFLMQIKNFQEKVRSANLMIHKKLQQPSKEIEFVSVDTEDLPITSNVEEYIEDENNQYVESVTRLYENTVIKTENEQNIFTNENEDICDTINPLNENNQHISEDDQISIKTEIEETDTIIIGMDELSKEESHYEPIEAEYLTASVNRHLSTLEKNMEAEENEGQCDRYEDFLKEANGTSEDIADAANNATLNVLPEKSRQKYELIYSKFKQWCKNKEAGEITENVLLEYFSEKAKQLKSSSLWSTFSMLKASLEVKEDINIKKFSKLIAFLKWKSTGYSAEKSKTFSIDEIKRFLLQAPDDSYLLMKVVLILGVAGACRRDELCKISVEDFDDTGNVIIVNIPKSETDKERFFIIQDDNEDLSMANIYRKYAALRPAAIAHTRFLLYYKRGQCTSRPIGINAIGKMPSDIAKYLELDNPNSYTGHCFRRSSAILLANTGANVLSLKRHGGWKSKAAAERYIKESQEKETANQFFSGDNCQNISAVTDAENEKNTPSLLPSSSIPSSLNFQQNVPPDIADATNNATFNVLPERSRQQYELMYTKFKQWCENKEVSDITENVLLEYFLEKAKLLKSSSLWATFSMLRASLEVKENINIREFSKLTAFLKLKSKGYRPQKSKALSRDEIKKFLLQAPDDKYLMMKVVLILGIAGACRRDELCKMSVDSFEDAGSVIIVNIPTIGTDKGRYFIIQGENENLNMADIFRKYAALRPVATEHRRFFLCYRQGKCTIQPVGINTIGKIPSDIAKYLGLNNPNNYTGHCFRRSSATLLTNTNANILSLKEHENWKSKVPFECYIKKLWKNEKTANQCLSGDNKHQTVPIVADAINKDEKTASSAVPSSSISSDISSDIAEITNNASFNSLPEKSRQRYELIYSRFKQWCDSKEVSEITENVLLEYFLEKAKQFKSSSLWSIFSMLRASLEAKEDINIKNFSKLTAFLRGKAKGYCAKKSKTFSRDEMKRFLLQAPDDKYLLMKVVLILGVTGACRGDELCKMSVDNFEDTGNVIIARIPQTETEKERYFIIQGKTEDLNMADIFRKYAALRPTTILHKRFFLCYRQGKCTVQPVGIHTIGKTPSDIAKYLGLNNPDNYTGRCFRRSSATLLTSASANVLSLKEHTNHFFGFQQNTSVFTVNKEENNTSSAVLSSSISSDINLQQSTSPDIVDATNSLLPEKSRHKYELIYNRFKQWCENKEIGEITENVLLEYFSEMAKQFKSSSLWSAFSMLRASLEAKEDINIKKFSKLTAFLKGKSKGYCAKKSKTFSRDEIKRFLLQAPDDKYLMMKVVLILGVAGACRRDELCKMSIDYFEDTGSVIIVNIPRNASDKERHFVIQDKDEDINMVEIFRKYATLRPVTTKHKRFFLSYRQGKCTVQPVGINTIGKIPNDIAKYLGLNNPKGYTGHCFRRSSATLLANAGADVLSLKRHGGWKSKAVAGRYVRESRQKEKIANQLLSGDSYQENTPAVADAVNKDEENSLPAVPSSSIL